ncbi:hypothetical protein FE391_30715, partial [Nonomuraea sp. KC401]
WSDGRSPGAPHPAHPPSPPSAPHRSPPPASRAAPPTGGKGELFGAWGDTGVAQARRLVDIALDAGVTLPGRRGNPLGGVLLTVVLVTAITSTTAVAFRSRR